MKEGLSGDKQSTSSSVTISLCLYHIHVRQGMNLGKDIQHL